jgi:hypothetical protein
MGESANKSPALKTSRRQPGAAFESSLIPEIDIPDILERVKGIEPSS